MREETGLKLCIAGAAMIGALAGCAGQGARYSEVVTPTPVASGQARIVLLRPNNRYDDYSLSRAQVRVNNAKPGKLAYGGFLVVDIDAGDVAVSASARNRMFGTCELRIEILPGDTVYLDVAPRTANVVAGLVGSVAGEAAVGSGPSHVGVGEVLVDKSSAPGAVASAAGGMAASAAESVGKQCGGPFKLTQIHASAALEQLPSLTWSQ